MVIGNRLCPLLLSLLIVLPGVLLLAPDPAPAVTRIVHCPGRKVGIALRVPARGDLTILISGTCREALRINRDNVTLKAAEPGASTIEGDGDTTDTILIAGAKNVTIDGLVVTKGRRGIHGTDGASFTVKNKALVQENLQSGIVASFGTSVFVDDADVKNNGRIGAVTGVPDLGRNGVAVADSSSGVITNSRISGNVGSGVVVTRSSSARIGLTVNTEAAPNTIDHNRDGVFVDRGSDAALYGNLIEANTRWGSFISDATARSLTNNIVTGNGSHGIQVSRAKLTQGRFGFAAAPRPDLPAEKQNRDLINDNVGAGVNLFDGSAAQFDEIEVVGNQGEGINADTNSTVFIQRGTISGYGRKPSTLARSGPPTLGRSDPGEEQQRETESGTRLGTEPDHPPILTRSRPPASGRARRPEEGRRTTRHSFTLRRKANTGRSAMALSGGSLLIWHGPKTWGHRRCQRRPSRSTCQLGWPEPKAPSPDVGSMERAC